MTSPYVGEIRLFAGSFAPQGWAVCDGSVLSTSAYGALFELIGTTYGGDGQTTFGLPDLRSRVPVHQGPGFGLGMSGGAEVVTLGSSQLPRHSHLPQAATTSTQNSPSGGLWASGDGPSLYANGPASEAMAVAAVGTVGGGQPHDNMLPFLAINFIIALSGIFPSQT